MIHSFWIYFHNHWQDNVLAGFIYSAIVFPIGYMAGLRKHLNRIHAHNERVSLKLEQIHKKVK